MARSNSRRIIRVALNSFLRIVTNLFLFTLISVLVIDTSPFGHVGPVKFERVKRWQSFLTHNVLHQIGLWQHVWDIFAPEPLHSSLRLSADLTYYLSNNNNIKNLEQTTRQWKSLNFTNMTLYEWKRYNRMISYISEIQGEGMEQRKAYIPFIRYLAETETLLNEETGELLKPDKITLYRHQQYVRPPPKTPQQVQALMIEEEEKKKRKNYPEAATTTSATTAAISKVLGPQLIKRYKDEETYVMFSWERGTPL
jgi:hypothetical protein